MRLLSLKIESPTTPTKLSPPQPLLFLGGRLIAGLRRKSFVGVVVTVCNAPQPLESSVGADERAHAARAPYPEPPRARPVAHCLFELPRGERAGGEQHALVFSEPQRREKEWRAPRPRCERGRCMRKQRSPHALSRLMAGAMRGHFLSAQRGAFPSVGFSPATLSRTSLSPLSSMIEIETRIVMS